MTGTCAACLHTNQSRSYLNHLVFLTHGCVLKRTNNPGVFSIFVDIIYKFKICG
jgi:hypothetical protein